LSLRPSSQDAKSNGTVAIDPVAAAIGYTSAGIATGSEPDDDADQYSRSMHVTGSVASGPGYLG
jgi:hypothetical protein